MSSVEYVERSFRQNFDFPLLGMTIILCGFGVAAIYSSNLQSDSQVMQILYSRQVYWILISLAAMAVVAWMDYRFIERMAYPLYAAGIASLVLVELYGRSGGGSQRWLSMAGLNFQPSEIMKIAVIILLARIFDEIRTEESLGLRELIKPAALVAIPFFIVARQPDLGTAMIFVLLFGCIAVINGVKRRLLAILAGLTALLAPSFWFFLKPYQQNRIIAILNPEADPMGQGYHIIQSKIAIGSGGVWGKGIFQGTQSKLNFLPAKHTDFIFSVFAEEAGFVGSVILIIVFYFFIMRLLEIAMSAKDKFGTLLVFGIATMIAFNFVYNIGMTLGLFPIVGIPLPFISYGGSSLFTNFIAIGLALNVSMGRFRLE